MQRGTTKRPWRPAGSCGHEDAPWRICQPPPGPQKTTQASAQTGWAQDGCVLLDGGPQHRGRPRTATSFFVRQRRTLVTLEDRCIQIARGDGGNAHHHRTPQPFGMKTRKSAQNRVFRRNEGSFFPNVTPALHHERLRRAPLNRPWGHHGATMGPQRDHTPGLACAIRRQMRRCRSSVCTLGQGKKAPRFQGLPSLTFSAFGGHGNGPSSTDSAAWDHLGTTAARYNRPGVFRG